MEKYYWFGVVGEYDEHCGEEFIIAAASAIEARSTANKLFPGEKIQSYGRVSEFESEMMGLDVY